MKNSLFLSALIALLSYGASHAAVIRYIEVSSAPGTGAGSNNFFNIGEIEAFLVSTTPAAGLDNVNDQAISSKLATATTTSGIYQHGSNGALINGVQSSGAATWGYQDADVEAAIALVDLGASLDIGTVRIWERSGCCSPGRLVDFTVNVYADGGGTPGALVDTFFHPGAVAANSSVSFNPVPEPSAALFLGLGSLSLIVRRRR